MSGVYICELYTKTFNLVPPNIYCNLIIKAKDYLVPV